MIRGGSGERTVTLDASFETALQASLDSLLAALDLEPVDEGRFRVGNEARRFDRVFGGQLLAQAVIAAAATVGDDKQPQSLHASFVEGAVHDEPLDIAVINVRDGRSMSLRQVTLTQCGSTVLTAQVAFHANPSEPDVRPAEPAGSIGRAGLVASAPTDLPLLQDLIRALPVEAQTHGLPWIQQPPPLELRLPEPPSFLSGAESTEPRAHWMRLPSGVGGDPVQHAALLTYASDYFLLDMALRAHPDRAGAATVASTSLDHAIWFHRPTRFEQWHRYTQELVTMAGHRGLVRGAIHDERGDLVASVTQEVLVRPTRGTGR